MKTNGGIEHQLLLGHYENSKSIIRPELRNDFIECYDAMMYSDSYEYLPNDILVKVDRASMAVGLETRTPLLDHRVVELAWRIPLHKKIKNGKGKLPLRHLLKKYIPNNLIERPKMGFNLPISEWLRGPLKDWSSDLLSKEKLLKYDYFEPKYVHEILSQHYLKKNNWYLLIWRILAFQAWMQHTKK